MQDDTTHDDVRIDPAIITDSISTFKYQYDGIKDIFLKKQVWGAYAPQTARFSRRHPIMTCT